MMAILAWISIFDGVGKDADAIEQVVYRLFDPPRKRKNQQQQIPMIALS